jgi:competence protein ComEC
VVECASHAPVSGATLPSTGTAFELDAIDVGTGLSVFVKGPDFNLLYDAGSNDDKAQGSANRVLSYFNSAEPDVARLDHLILSHPHQDHVALMADVVRTLRPHDVWDSGATTSICGYREFLKAVAETPGVVYHNANLNAGDETRSLARQNCDEDEPAQTITVRHGDRLDATPIVLGAHATLTFLHVDGVTHASDLNKNSLVARIDLGNHAVLLMGDAEAGGRQNPSVPPGKGSVERILLQCCIDHLRADVLVVGHHGSMTSSRKELLDAVGAKIFIVSAGPFPYQSVVLPDNVVINELRTRGTVWRTDVNDGACRTATSKIGPANDGKPGGCSNVRLTFDDSGVRGQFSP